MVHCFSKLDEVIYRGKELQIEIVSTIVADRVTGSAESIWGADFAVVAVLSDVSPENAGRRN